MCGALLECRDCEDEGAGRCSVAGTLEHLVGGGGAGGLLPGASPAPHSQHPPNMLQPMEEMILPPKRQAVVDRLRRRIETYRRRQSECVPRFDQSFTGACEQQNLETSALQKRFLEGKAKRQVKKTERKPDLPAISGNLHSSVVHVQQKFGCGDYEPPAKLHCGSGAGGGLGGEALTKFSVEIVQQLEFTTSAADSQPQQISTNVTVKALANAVKTSNSPPPQQPPPRAPTPLDIDRECKAECKSEVADDEYGLDECAAALERDSAFPGLAELIGEDDGDDTFEDLITEISEYPELIDFDLDGGKMNNVGLDSSDGDCGSRGYGGGGEMSPAAQTLKQMAEQHQQAAGDWRFRGYGPYRPRAPAPPPQSQPCHPPDHLHLSQHQQLHLSQPHHTLQVSAAQHMQVNGSGGHVSVAAQQGMYANFQHQGTPSPQHHQGGNGCDTYSMSQSQSINFSQTMRARPAAPQASAPGPGQAPLGVAAAGISREQQAKMLQQQQQQMLRAQQQMRPPPPEYKARFVGVGNVGNVGGVPIGARRPTAPTPRAFAPHARPYTPEWRHVLMQQQQQATRQQFPHHHQGFNLGGMGGGMSQQQQMQLQQARMQQQQQQLMQQHQQQHQQRTSSQQQPSMSQLIMQQNQMMNVQGHMPNIHMSQSQSMSMGGMGGMGGVHQGSPMQAQGGPMHAQNASMQSMMPQSQSGPGGMQQNTSSQHSFPSLHSSSFAGHTDFNLDFLDNLPSTEASNLTAQELLNSLDNSFLNDIL